MFIVAVDRLEQTQHDSRRTVRVDNLDPGVTSPPLNQGKQTCVKEQAKIGSNFYFFSHVYLLFFRRAIFLYAYLSPSTYCVHRINAKFGTAQAVVCCHTRVKRKWNKERKWARNSQSEMGTPKSACLPYPNYSHWLRDQFTR